MRGPYHSWKREDDALLALNVGLYRHELSGRRGQRARRDTWPSIARSLRAAGVPVTPEAARRRARELGIHPRRPLSEAGS